MTDIIQQNLFDISAFEPKKKGAKDYRNESSFLRNQFYSVGKYGFPLIKKQTLNLDNVNLIACTNTIKNDREYFDYGVHFFVDDIEFGGVYADPGKTFDLYSQYRFCLTPDYSIYAEMPLWRQIESVAYNRWCGAWWQSRGMTVIPTISWDKYPSFEFCFDGVERGSIVAVATYACRSNRAGFLRGFEMMLEKICPEAVICYGEPFAEMKGLVIPIEVKHPRQFHREM